MALIYFMSNNSDQIFVLLSTFGLLRVLCGNNTLIAVLFSCPILPSCVWIEMTSICIKGRKKIVSNKTVGIWIKHGGNLIKFSGTRPTCAGAWIKLVLRLNIFYIHY